MDVGSTLDLGYRLRLWAPTSTLCANCAVAELVLEQVHMLLFFQLIFSILRQTWCNLQVKLSDPCLSALRCLIK